jgi:hypothetical protein
MRLTALLCLLGCACATTKPAPVAQKAAPQQAQAAATPVKTEVKGDEVVRTFDLNGDGKPDLTKRFRIVPDPKDPARRIEQLVSTELDSNFDGKVDIWTWFDASGEKTKEAFDLDFDGRPDVIRYYEKGVLVRKETFHGRSDRPSQVAHYEGGVKVRVERDDSGKGRFDTFEHYENGRLQRIGYDLDGDGTIDRWVQAQDSEE